MGSHHAIDGLSRKDEQLFRNACPPILLEYDWEVPPHSICRSSVPGIVVRRLVTGQAVHKALLFGASEHRRGIRLCDVGVEGVGVELGQHIPAGMQQGNTHLALAKKPSFE